MIAALPIRIRLTLPFALAMAFVLAALGGFVYDRVGGTLLRSTDDALSSQAVEATQRIEAGRPLLDRDALAGASFAEILNSDGSVLAGDPSGVHVRLPEAEIGTVLAGGTQRRTVTIPGRAGRWRLLAVSTTTANGTVAVLVLGSSLRIRDESLERLQHELLFASPLALILATLAGYLLAGAALRPVEAMRRKAGAITAATPGVRLPVPRARDEISRLAETLNDMLGRLETAFEHERRFVADASHELRTPLALLRTELELALRKPRSHAELEDALRSAVEETDRLTALAADLLLIARSDQLELTVDREQISALDSLGAVAGRFAARAQQTGRPIEVDDATEIEFAADPKRIEQAVGNMVENALVHGAGTITLSARRVGDRVELHVTDQGSGFPDGFAARAFDRFSRADEARRRSGSGLGLAIVAAIAKAHDGTTGVLNRPSGGADVWIAVPLAPAGRPSSLRAHTGFGRRRGTGRREATSP